MTSAPTTLFVPTLDIDLAWHTHQMKGKKYNADCMKYLKRLIDQSVYTLVFAMNSLFIPLLVMTRLKKIISRTPLTLHVEHGRYVL